MGEREREREKGRGGGGGLGWGRVWKGWRRGWERRDRGGTGRMKISIFLLFFFFCSSLSINMFRLLQHSGRIFLNKRSKKDR